MELSASILPLQLKHPWCLSTGTSTIRHNVLVRLDQGVGEAAVVPHLGHTTGAVLEVLHACREYIEQAEGDPALLMAVPKLPRPVLSALDMAMHDRLGKELGLPLYRLWGLKPEASPPAIRSFAAGDPETFRQRVRAESQGFSMIKVKVGNKDGAADEQLVSIARQETQARIGIDANGAWTAEQAAAMIERLMPYDLAFIEQPIGADDYYGWFQLRQHVPPGGPALIADESFQSATDAPRLLGLVDGVNVKLAKSGGFTAARQAIDAARVCGLNIMLGGMIESSIGVSAAAQLAPLADWVDLDGHLQLTQDPYVGLEIVDGRLVLPQRPGIGAIIRGFASRGG